MRDTLTWNIYIYFVSRVEIFVFKDLNNKNESRVRYMFSLWYFHLNLLRKNRLPLSSHTKFATEGGKEDTLSLERHSVRDTCVTQNLHDVLAIARPRVVNGNKSRRASSCGPSPTIARR